MASVADLEAELAEINTAISQILGSLTQEHWNGGDRHRSPELSQLFAERARLRGEIAKAQSSGGAKTFPIQVIN